MTIRLLPPKRPEVFPDPATADPDGLLAVGGDLSPERLLAAYRRGIFPWFGPGEPILWWSPDPRTVLFPSELHLPRRLLHRMRQRPFRLTADRAFEAVIRGCAAAGQRTREGTWIVPEMVAAYSRLHRLGHAHSVEAWLDGQLAGGLYGVSIGGSFCGESMFARVSDASKIAFAFLLENLTRRGCRMVDCQVASGHLFRFGARPVPRQRFLEELSLGLKTETIAGPWRWGEGAVDESKFLARLTASDR